MDETRMQNEHDEDASHEPACPICLLMKAVTATRKKHSAFFDHLMNAQIEVLQAFKCVIDQQISCLEEKKSRGEEGKKATKIPVE
jgi:hypothetical protein